MMELGRAIIDGPPTIIDEPRKGPPTVPPIARLVLGNVLASPPPKPRKVERQKTDYDILQDNENFRALFFVSRTRVRTWPSFPL